MKTPFIERWLLQAIYDITDNINMGSDLMRISRTVTLKLQCGPFCFLLLALRVIIQTPSTCSWLSVVRLQQYNLL